MTAGERSQLLGLIKKRERVTVAELKRRSAALLTAFEKEVAAKYNWGDEDADVAQAVAAAEAAITEANATLAARGRTLGYPDRLVPEVRSYLKDKDREVRVWVDDLRRAAGREIAARERDAIARVERESLAAQTDLIAANLISKAARAFLEKLPPIEQLLPPVDVRRIEQLLERDERG
jgi:hypothetical protein